MCHPWVLLVPGVALIAVGCDCRTFGVEQEQVLLVTFLKAVVWQLDADGMLQLLLLWGIFYLPPV